MTASRTSSHSAGSVLFLLSSQTEVDLFSYAYQSQHLSDGLRFLDDLDRFRGIKVMSQVVLDEEYDTIFEGSAARLSRESEGERTCELCPC